MRIGVLADVHGNNVALAAALASLGDVDAFMFLGDLAGYYPFVGECLDLWPKKRMWAVRGNHDQILLDCVNTETRPSAEYVQQCGSGLERAMAVLPYDAYDTIRGWPLRHTPRIDGIAFLLCHGAPWDPLEGRVYPDALPRKRLREVRADYLLMGHTHYPFVARVGEKTVVNPGSVGQARNKSGMAFCALIDTGRGGGQIVSARYSPDVLIADARSHDPTIPYLVEVLTR